MKDKMRTIIPNYVDRKKEYFLNSLGFLIEQIKRDTDYDENKFNSISYTLGWKNEKDLDILLDVVDDVKATLKHNLEYLKELETEIKKMN
tara:strand:- start:424 stop:693 length:270 start_codon:yes stop_codon:yes gene_type:complete